MAVVKLVFGGEDGAEELDGRHVQVAVRGAQHAQGSGDDVVAHDEVLHAVRVPVHAQAQHVEKDAARCRDRRCALPFLAWVVGTGTGAHGCGSLAGTKIEAVEFRGRVEAVGLVGLDEGRDEPVYVEVIKHAQKFVLVLSLQALRIQ